MNRKDIHLSLTTDQYDDLTSALETQGNDFQRMSTEASNEFGYLDSAYWAQRVNDMQYLLDAVHSLAQDDTPEVAKPDMPQA